MSDLQESVMLWLPSHMVDDEETTTNVTRANGLIMDFCDLDAPIEQVLDEFSTMGFSPDDFREVLDHQLRRRGV